MDPSWCTPTPIAAAELSAFQPTVQRPPRKGLSLPGRAYPPGAVVAPDVLHLRVDNPVEVAGGVKDVPIATKNAHVGDGVSAAALLEEHQVPAPQVGPRPDLVPVLELQDRGIGHPLEAPEDDLGKAGTIFLYVRPAGGWRREAIRGAAV